MMISRRLAAVLLLVFIPFYIASAEKRPMKFEDVMKFKAITSSAISEDGKYVVYSVAPDRGNPSVYIKSLVNDSVFTLDRASNPVISKNARWVATTATPNAWELENAEKDKQPKNGMYLLNTLTGKYQKNENVKKFVFSNDSKWLAFLLADTSADSKKREFFGTDLLLRHLESGSDMTINSVTEFAFDSTAGFIAYAVSEPAGKKNGIYYINLKDGFTFPMKIMSGDSLIFSGLTWNNQKKILAFVKSRLKKDNTPDLSSLFTWNPSTFEYMEVVKPADYPKDWKLPFKNNLRWTKDGNRLFFGYKPLSDSLPGDNKVTFNDSSFYDTKTILKKTDLDVWHWNDPRIKTHQKDWWDKNKDRTFPAVYNIETNKAYQLASLDLPYVNFVENANYTIGYDDTPYLREATWGGEYRDLYLVDLRTGTKRILAKHLLEDAEISPLGKYVVYFKNKNWNIYNIGLDSTYVLNAVVNYSFADELWDRPGEPQSYGIGGWLVNDAAVLIYDRYDIWKFYTDPNVGYFCQTAIYGRDYKTTFRLIPKLDPDQVAYNNVENVYLTGFDENTKSYGIYRMNMNILGYEPLREDSLKRFRIIAKAKNADVYLFSRESYDEFPDLMVSDSTFKNPKRISDVNPQMKDLLWGKTELVRWTNFEGDTLDGYIIKPENFQQGRKYPVLIYFYERFSEMMNIFSQPRINHRPCYQLYSSDGYIVFVPDIKYYIGKPGYSALSALVSGVRKLASMGIADTTAIGLQGHSWGGYQTAYLATQTDLFAAAAAGAPVGNMTSAYSGIRLESGMARQFQYEVEQSRIGGTLWDSLQAYISNSPIFQAKNTKTPLLIEFGDEDEAVPFQQGVELYLAMRRLNKNAIMLQYHKEPHHPRKYQNKLDYAIRMKEFFDTYLKKMPAPDWILNGVEYMGK